MLDSNSSITLYNQIREYILENIRLGNYKKGQRIPSERELSSILGVSRMTVRQAISSLVKKIF
jgi:GntR family transcriptional regulator